MAVAVIQEWPQQGEERSTQRYDALHKRLMRQATGPPEGFRAHAAGWTETSFRIIEIWDTREQFEAYLRDHVMAAVRERGGGANPPQVTLSDLQELVIA